MKNKHLYLPAAAVTLLCLSSPAWAGNACAALSAIYQSMPVGNPNAPSVMKGLRGALKTCRSQLAALSPAAAASAAAPAADGRFVIFDVPGEDTSYGPVPAAINNAGAVAGYYLDAGFAEHSFLRAPDGTITTFDPPGTACTPGAFCSTAIGITPGGVVMGSYVDLTGGHGYLRTPDGQFQKFDVPGSNNSTDPQGINAAGSVTGVYTGSGGLFHGFLRQANGIYTTFDPPSSVYTWPTDISSSGSIVGYYLEADPGLVIGFLRTTNGSFTPFNAPNGGFLNTAPTIAINAQGTVTGSFCNDALCDVALGFLRANDGTMTVFAAPGDNILTGPDAINAAGDTTGWSLLSDFSALHGFVRSHQGTIATIDPPGSSFTFPFAINDPGAVAGNFCDPTQTTCHGFVWIPHR
ncbi:hypothetical protein AB4Y42_23565 [Paraburkholderia sp. EG286B]|uniref:hypothetical protein n=1 Tax=Paraburkholderia sp. EG286B TaxID=3237011 RepID=UPI0034D360E9